MTKPTFTIADIEAQVSKAEAVDFEPFLPSGNPSGLILQVLSEQAPSVVAGLQALRDQRKRKEQMIEAKARNARPGEHIITAEEDDDYYRRLTVVRLAGWKGLDDPFTQENAVRLLKAAPTFSSQIINRATELGSFTRPSSES